MDRKVSGAGREKRRRGTGRGIPLVRTNPIGPHVIHEYKVRIPRPVELARVTGKFAVKPPRSRAQRPNRECVTDLTPHRRLVREWLAENHSIDFVRTKFETSPDALTRRAADIYIKMVKELNRG